MLRRGALCQAQQRGARQLPDRPRAGVREPHDSRVAEDAHADGIGAGGDALDGRGPADSPASRCAAPRIAQYIVCPPLGPKMNVAAIYINSLST